MTDQPDLIRTRIEATPGEEVRQTACRAIDAANEPTDEAYVIMEHNDILLRVYKASTVDELDKAWQRAKVERERRARAPEVGVWVSYYGDSQGVSVFATELDALRHALGYSANVGFLKFGSDVQSAQRTGDTE